MNDRSSGFDSGDGVNKINDVTATPHVAGGSGKGGVIFFYFFLFIVLFNSV